MAVTPKKEMAVDAALVLFRTEEGVSPAGKLMIATAIRNALALQNKTNNDIESFFEAEGGGEEKNYFLGLKLLKEFREQLKTYNIAENNDLELEVDGDIFKLSPELVGRIIDLNIEKVSSPEKILEDGIHSLIRKVKNIPDYYALETLEEFNKITYKGKDGTVLEKNALNALEDQSIIIANAYAILKRKNLIEGNGLVEAQQVLAEITEMKKKYSEGINRIRNGIMEGFNQLKEKVEVYIELLDIKGGHKKSFKDPGNEEQYGHLKSLPYGMLLKTAGDFLKDAGHLKENADRIHTTENHYFPKKNAQKMELPDYKIVFERVQTLQEILIKKSVEEKKAAIDKKIKEIKGYSDLEAAPTDKEGLELTKKRVKELGREVEELFSEIEGLRKRFGEKNFEVFSEIKATKNKYDKLFSERIDILETEAFKLSVQDLSTHPQVLEMRKKQTESLLSKLEEYNQKFVKNAPKKTFFGTDQVKKHSIAKEVKGDIKSFQEGKLSVDDLIVKLGSALKENKQATTFGQGSLGDILEEGLKTVKQLKHQAQGPGPKGTNRH